MAATVVLKDGKANTTGTSGWATNSFTPTANDLLVVFAVVSGSVDASPTLIDSLGLVTFSMVASAVYATSANIVYMFVANQLATAAARTLTLNVPNDAGTGSVIFTYGVAGMNRTGSAAVKQSAKTDNGSASGTPAATFGLTTLTGNATLGCVGNSTSPATLTPPASWTETASIGDLGYSTPTTGGESVFRNSGFVGTTITWGSTSASVYGVLIAELDTSPALVSLASTIAAQSTQSSALSVVGKPTAINATGITSVIFSAEWLAPTNGDTPTGYKLTVSLNSDLSSPLAAYSALDVSNVLKYQVGAGNLTRSTTYYFGVQAYTATATGPMSNAVTVALPAVGIVWLDPGTDHTFDTSHYPSLAGAVTPSTDFAHTGTHSLKFDTTAVEAGAAANKTGGIISDTGFRTSIWIYLPSYATSRHTVIQPADTGFLPVASIYIDSAGKVGIKAGNTLLPVGATAIALNTWTRLSASFRTTSLTNWEVVAWLDGVEQTRKNNTHASLVRVGTSFYRLGMLEGTAGESGANKLVYMDDIYVDDAGGGALLGTDTGDIRVTAKLAISAGTNNDWDTLGGAGTNRWDRVSDRPTNVANFIEQGATTQAYEDFTLQAAAVGEVDISAATVVGYGGWWGAKSVAADYAYLVLNGVDYRQLLTTSAVRYNQFITSSAYPSSAAGIGMRSTGTANDTYMLECGVVVAYVLVASISLASSIAAASGASSALSMTKLPSGTAVAQSGESATLKTAHQLAAASLTQSGMVGAVALTKKLSALPAAQSGQSSALSMTKALRSTIPAQAAQTSALAMTKLLLSTTLAQSADSAILGTTHQLASSIADQSALAAAISLSKLLRASVAGASAQQSLIVVTHPLASVVASVSILVGNLSTTHLLVSSAQGQSSLSGALSAGRPLAGSVVSASNLLSALALTKRLSGAPASLSSLSAAMSLSKLLYGPLSALSGQSSALALTKGLVGSLGSASSVSASLALTKKLASVLAAQSADQADLTLFGLSMLTSSIHALSALSGALSISHNLSGQLAGQSVDQATLLTSKRLAASAVSASALSSALSLTKLLSSRSDPGSNISAALSSVGFNFLTSAPFGQSAMSARLLTAHALASSVSSASAMSGTVGVVKGLRGAVGSGAIVSGSIATYKFLASLVAARSAGVAPLLVVHMLAALPISSQSGMSGDLGTIKVLRSAVFGRSEMADAALELETLLYAISTGQSSLRGIMRIAEIVNGPYMHVLGVGGGALDSVIMIESPWGVLTIVGDPPSTPGAGIIIEG